MDARDYSLTWRDEALNEPGIDLLTSVAVVDAILLDYRPLPVRVPASGARCAVGCLHDFDPVAGLRILEHVTLPDLRQRHLLCYVFRAHYLPDRRDRSAASTLR